MMKNSMVEQILALVEENRTLRCCAEGSRREAEALAKELERVLQFGETWHPQVREKFFHSIAQASNWGYQPMLGNVAKDFKYPIPEEMLGREQAHHRTVTEAQQEKGGEQK